MVTLPSPIVELLMFPDPVHQWDENPKGTFPGEPLPLTPDFGCSTEYNPIGSQSFVDVVQPFIGDQAQFLPFDLASEDKSSVTLSGYHLLHVTAEVDCLDRKLTRVRNDDWSALSSDEDFLQVIPPLHMRFSAIRDFAMFRIKGYPIHVIVREDVKAAIEESGLSGTSFEEVLVSGV